MRDSGRDIPLNVLFDILLWLPVVSLLRFKRVCKSWCALVENPSFIMEHLHCSNSREGALFARCVELDDGRRYVGFLMLIYGNEYQKCSKDYMQKLLPSGIVVNRYGLVGCCDGMVCLRTANDLIGDLALFNPATKQLRHLPKPLLTPPVEAGSRYHVIGFGFDFKANDYKIVRILFYADEPGSYIYNVKIVEVYSKGSDSWRNLHKKGDSLPFKVIDHYPQATSKNGTCFWIGKGFDGTHILVSFDLNGEVFGTMSLPNVDSSDRAYGLDFFNDNLVYMKGVEPTCFYEHGHTFFEIWALHEFGIEDSWNKLYKIGPIFVKRPHENDNYRPIRISRNGEFVILMRDYDAWTQRGELHLYNLRIQNNKHPRIEPLGGAAFELFHYNESLVSVKSQ